MQNNVDSDMHGSLARMIHLVEDCYVSSSHLDLHNFVPLTDSLEVVCA